MAAVQAHDRQRRLADERLPDPGRPSVLRRHLLPGRAAPRDAVVPPGAGRGRPGVARAARPRSRRPGRRLVGRGWSGSSSCGRRRPTMPGRPAGRCWTPPRPPSRARSTRANGGWGGAPEVPAADDHRVPAAPPSRHRRRRARWRSPGARSTRWPTAASATSSGGGFHRYATDARWLVPHFEQMLYDNAQLARVYLHAWALTGDARVPRGRDRDARLHGPRAHDRRRSLRRQPGRRHGRCRGRSPSRGAPTEIRESSVTTRRCSRRPTASPTRATGKGVTILSRVREDEALAEAYGLTTADVASRLAAARALLLARRRERAQPARDDKALAAWNGLAIAAFAEAAPVRSDGAGSTSAAATRAAEAIVAGLLGAGRRARAVAGRTVGRPGTACSRTMRTSPRASSRCTRRPSTSAGSRRPWRLRTAILDALRRPGRRLLRHRGRSRARS